MDSIPMDLFHAHHDEERRIFSRMVFILGLEPNLSMKIIAFWLWLEENKCKDVVQRLNSLDDSYLLRVCDVAKSFLDSLQLSYLSKESHFKQDFRDVAICGINYYLHNVCHNVLLDIRKQVHQSFIEKLVKEMGRAHFSSESIRKTGCSNIRIKNFTDGGRIKEGNSYTCKELTPLDLNKIYAWNPFFYNSQNSLHTDGGFLRCKDRLQYHSTMKDVANCSLSSNVSSSTDRKIPREERTLFVTFSNGHPLSEEQLRTFFMRHFGDVERVYAPEQADNKPSLYARVTFCSLATLVRVLNSNGNGNDNGKVKFVIEGKHVWARRFIPKNEYKQHLK